MDQSGRVPVHSRSNGCEVCSRSWMPTSAWSTSSCGCRDWTPATLEAPTGRSPPKASRPLPTAAGQPPTPRQLPTGCSQPPALPRPIRSTSGGRTCSCGPANWPSRCRRERRIKGAQLQAAEVRRGRGETCKSRGGCSPFFTVHVSLFARTSPSLASLSWQAAFLHADPPSSSSAPAWNMPDILRLLLASFPPCLRVLRVSTTFILFSPTSGVFRHF